MKQGLALRYLTTKAWALDGAHLQAMGEISARDLDNLDMSALGFPAPSALATRPGQKAQAGYEVRDGVAVISAIGVISRYAGMFEAICGGTSTQTLACQIQAALDDYTIRGIVLVVDSPGGEANGIHELAELIYSARGKKKIVGYTGGMAASAGYWVLSACEEVVIDATATAGSIGTVQTMRIRKASKDEPFETIEMVSSQSPLKRMDPKGKEGREAYQESLDQLAEVFVTRVAAYRGVTRDAVVNDFGQGWVLMGEHAVKAGMADKLGSLESVINDLKKGRNKAMSNTPAASAATIEQAISLSAGMTVSDAVASLAEVAPEVVAALVAENVEIGAALPDQATMATADVVSFITEARPDVMDAIKASMAPPVPAMAIAHAADIVQKAAAAGIPALAADLLKEGKTLAAAESAIAFASTLRVKLAAVGMDGAIGALMAVADKPADLVAVAIQEAQAQASGEAHINSEQQSKNSANCDHLDPSTIYANR
ncbi:S49 family peptidase [Aeromonas aquatica]|uniref:S49 family peptidase n=1 Tax=Aeromonas aquatica TaxID=558964 RepID=UPI00068FBECD|nr:S49 family peptidase [Aeromonas aquatica]